MKPISNYCFGVLTATAAMLLAVGCASEHVTADYTMPARAVTDVGAVSLLNIVSVAKLSGNRIADGDDVRAAELVRQHLSARLYQEGFYQITDTIWGPDIKGAAAIGEFSRKNSSRHGYANFSSMAPDATGRLELELELVVDADRQVRNEEITLTSIPYVDTPRTDPYDRPSSYPNPDTSTHIKRVVAANYEVWKVSGTGSLKAKLFNSKTGKLVYEKTFEVSPPDNDPRCEPTLLRAIAAAVDPAIREILFDISPHEESRSLEVNEDAHPRIVALLAAKDFIDTVLEVEQLEIAKKKAPTDKNVYTPVAADFENKAVALEVLGRYAESKMAWKEALKLQPDYAPALEGLKRIDGILSGKQKIKDSGAGKTGNTGYKKDAVNQQAL